MPVGSCYSAHTHTAIPLSQSCRHNALFHPGTACPGLLDNESHPDTSKQFCAAKCRAAQHQMLPAASLLVVHCTVLAMLHSGCILCKSKPLLQRQQESWPQHQDHG